MKVVTNEHEETAQILRDMFLEKWGFREPVAAHREAYDRDIETIRWVDSIARLERRRT